MLSLRQSVRYNPLVEWAQYVVRRNPLLSIPFVNIDLTIEPGDLIIDCGANVGDVTSRFARSGAIVYAFEPNALCFSILSRRFQSMSSVHCFNKGVMDRQTTLTLNTPKPQGEFDALTSTVAASFVAQSRYNSSQIETQEVDCIDLSEFIRSLPKKVRVLKLDIEGSEITVLNHLMDQGTFDFIDFAVVETHEEQIPSLSKSTDDLRRRIEQNGLSGKINLDWQ